MIGVITSSGAGGDCRLQRRCSSPATKADGALRAVSATTTPTLAERSPGGQRGYPWDDESWFGWETTEISPRLEEKTRLWSVLEPKDQKRRVLIMWYAGKVGRPHQQVCRATAEWKSWKRRAKRQLVDERDESAELLLMVDEKQPPRRSSLTLRRCRRFQEPPKICGAMSFLGQIVGRQPMTNIRDLALVGASSPPRHKEPRSPLRGARCFGGAETKPPVKCQPRSTQSEAGPTHEPILNPPNPSRGRPNACQLS